MKKRNLFGWFAMAAMVISSCSTDEVVNDYSPENAIQFGTYVGRDAQGRGTVITEEGNGTPSEQSLQSLGFGVFTYYTDESVYNAGTSPCNFMYNTKVSTSAWTYSPIKYWPNDPGDKLTFFAYAPYDDHTNADDNHGNIDFDNQVVMEGDPIITFNVNNEVKYQTDLLISKTDNRNLRKNTGVSVDEKVTFNFAHALSRIGFTVKAIVDEVVAGSPQKLNASTTIVLKKVVLYGGDKVTGNTVPADASTNGIFYTQGKLNLNQSNANVVWDNCSGKQLFTLDNNDFVPQADAATMYDNEGYILTENTGIIGADKANSTKPNELNTDDSYLMIIPQNLVGIGFSVYVEYDVITLDSNLGDAAVPSTYAEIKSKVTNHISTPIEINFESGKAYKLNLQLGMTSVKIDADVVAWDTEVGSLVDLPKNEN